MEIYFYGPILRGQGVRTDDHWNDLLAEDYQELRFHISFLEAVGRRLRRTYGWIFAAQLGCFIAKIAVHPTPITSLSQLVGRASVGPLPGDVAIAFGLAFHLTWIVVALATLPSQKAAGLPLRRIGPDVLLKIAGGYRRRPGEPRIAHRANDGNH
jgi:uncharacterized membrane protein